MYGKIINTTCSISVELDDMRFERRGTGFVVGAHQVMTALHVLTNSTTMESSESGHILVTPNQGKMLRCEIAVIKEDADLAILDCGKAPLAEPLALSDEIPEIGDGCYWCGYPVLIGDEQTKRARLGWGRVNSMPYGPMKSFFEIDGNFNPGHSGSPVLVEKANTVVGVVSRSAGDPRNHFDKFRGYIEALNFIAPQLNLPSELLEAIQNVMGPGRYDLPSDSKEFMVEAEIQSSAPQISKEMIQTLKEVGVDIRQYSYFNIRKAFGKSDEPNSIPAVTIYGFNSILRGAINLILIITNGIEEAVNSTYQMGIGMVSGGAPFLDLINSIT